MDEKKAEFGSDGIFKNLRVVQSNQPKSLLQ